MSVLELTVGAIEAISEGASGVVNPIVQINEIKLVMTSQNKTERYRMLLSDGVYMHQSMLATGLNNMVKEGLQTGSIVRLCEFICNTIQNRRIIIVLNLEIIISESKIIGNPKLYEHTGSLEKGSLPAQQSANQPYGVSVSSVLLSGQNTAAPQYPKVEPITNISSFSGTASSYQNSYQKTEQFVGNSMDPRSNSSAQNQKFQTLVSGSGYSSLQANNNLGRNGQSYLQPSPLYSNRGPIAKNEAPARLIPISSLNPYQGRWTVKARVTTKSEMRRFSNPRGEGKVFSFDLLDAEGGEIRVTCFNTVADQFYNVIEIGKVYLISKGSLKPSQKTFNHINNDYEIFLESTSTVQPCLEEDNTIPRQTFNFRKISDIEGMENNSMVDVIGVVTSVSHTSTIMRKNGTETHKRNLQLKDMSGRSVEITFWGNFCNTEGMELQAMCDSGVFPILAIKSGRVNDFSGKSIGTISTSLLFINPDFPEAQILKDWYHRDGKNFASVSISHDSMGMVRNDARKTVSQIKDEGLGQSEKPNWIIVKATVMYVKVDNFCYTACPLMVGDRPCNKKVNNNGDGTWRCDRCDQNFPQCDYRYLLQIQIQDHTGMTWVTAFQECGEEIMGVTAKELYLIKYEEQDDYKFAEAIRRVYFNEYLFKLKVKEETFSDEQRVKSTVVKADKVNPSLECRHVLGLVEKLAVAGVEDSFLNAPGSSNTGFGNAEFKPTTNSMGGNNFISTHMNPGFTTRGSVPPQPLCSNCSSSGHNVQNCPRNTSAAMQPVGVVGGAPSRYSGGSSGGSVGNASDVCFKCQQPGHWSRDCPGPMTNSASTFGGSGNMSGRYSRTQLGGF